MKARKPHRLRYQKDLDNQQTLQSFLRTKVQEEKVEKQKFFKQLFDQIQRSLGEKDVDIFGEYVQNACLLFNNRKHKQADYKSKINSENNCEGVQVKKVQINADNNLRVFRRLNENLFEQQTSKIFPNYMTNRVQNKQRFISTPRLNKPKDLLVANKIFEINTKMKRNYKRLKQRVLGQACGRNQQRPYVFIRNSQSSAFDRSTRKFRLKTQTIQTNASESNFIPSILLSDLNYSKRDLIHRKMFGLQERRSQCFQRQSKSKRCK